MTAAHSTASTVLASVDISKYRDDALIGVRGKIRRRWLMIVVALQDFLCLVGSIAGYDMSVRSGCDATANDHWPPAHHLGLAGLILSPSIRSQVPKSALSLGHLRQRRRHGGPAGPSRVDAVRMVHLVPTESRGPVLRMDEIEPPAVAALPDIPHSQGLTTNPGIRLINCTTILAEAGDLCRF